VALSRDHGDGTTAPRRPKLPYTSPESVRRGDRWKTGFLAPFGVERALIRSDSPARIAVCGYIGTPRGSRGAVTRPSNPTILPGVVEGDLSGGARAAPPPVELGHGPFHRPLSDEPRSRPLPPEPRPRSRPLPPEPRPRPLPPATSTGAPAPATFRRARAFSPTTTPALRPGPGSGVGRRGTRSPRNPALRTTACRSSPVRRGAGVVASDPLPAGRGPHQ
jgi:hypothetical protein